MSFVFVTEMDCPIRFRAGVLDGVMTPVKLLDFTTGLTLLLLGSCNDINNKTSHSNQTGFFDK